MYARTWLALALLTAACSQENRQPTIDPIAPQSVRVGETLELAVGAHDADGDALVLTATPRPFTAHFEDRDGVTWFVWAPLISDTGPTGKLHKITFRADDSRGGLAVRDVVVNVLPASSAPEYVGPTGYVLNLSQDDDISFVVQVKDDDSAEIAFRLDPDVPAIEGAKLQRLDPKSMSFYWRPTPEQRLRQTYWQLVVGAKDEAHEEIWRSFSILLMNADAAKACVGRPPVVHHVPLEDQKGGGALVFEAYVTDDESDVREVTLHYTTANPSDPTVWTGNVVTLDPCDPASGGCPVGENSKKISYFLGSLASPAYNSSVPVPLHYYIEGIDNDDLKGTSCDHVTRLPKAGWTTVVSYPDGWPSKDCLDDPYEDNDDVASAKPIETGVSLDLRACKGDDDVYKLDVAVGDVVAVELMHAPEHGALSVSLVDGAGTLVAPLGETFAETLNVSWVATTTPVYIKVAIPESGKASDQGYGLAVTRAQPGCENDALEPNDTFEQAPLIGDGTVETVLCPGDTDYLAIGVDAGQSLIIDLDFQHQYGDLDLELTDSIAGIALGKSDTATSGEHLRYDADSSTTLILRVMGYQGQINTGELTIQKVDTQTLCDEDDFSPNHVQSQAALLPENLYEGISSCAGKKDWFRIDVNAGETIEIAVAPEQADQELTLQAFLDAAGKVPVGALSLEQDIVRLVVVAEKAGTVWWSVSTPGQYTFPYAMQFFVIDAPGACQDDRFSPIGTSDTALEVDNQVGFVTRLKLCPGGEDWFVLDGAAFETLFVYVFGFPDETPLEAELYDSEMKLIVTGESTSNGVELKTLPEDNSQFYVHVHGAPGQVNHYDLVIGLE